jgi:phosphatidylserine decarboxylase
MNSGNANKAAIRLLLWSAILLAGFFVAAWIGSRAGGATLAFHKVFISLWAVMVVALLYLFRDPGPIEPADARAIISPAHGVVDGIDNAVESEFMHQARQRISIRMSTLQDLAPIGARFGMRRPARRVNLYLPSAVKLHGNAGDEVVGGQSVVARFE